MPVRTHRGRAAVYRTVWGWPLRSGAHLAATATGLTVVLAGAGIALGAADQGTHHRPFAASGHVHVPRMSATTSPAPPSTPHPQPSLAPPATRNPVPGPATPNWQAEALTTADLFARGWVTHPAGITPRAWVAPLRPVTTDEEWPQLLTVNPASVPATTVTGPPTLTGISGPTAAYVDVPTDALVLRITVIRTPAGWRVTAYDQAS